MDRDTWWVTARGIAESDVTEQLTHFHLLFVHKATIVLDFSGCFGLNSLHSNSCVETLSPKAILFGANRSGK